VVPGVWWQTTEQDESLAAYTPVRERLCGGRTLASGCQSISKLLSDARRKAGLWEDDLEVNLVETRRQVVLARTIHTAII
jgi:hypothetical protein